jgi:putative transposase
MDWSMSRSLHSNLVVEALSMALDKCDEDTRFNFYSDLGSQYASEVFRELFKCIGLVPSMSRKGNCYDNCFVESSFKSLKSEWIYRHEYETEEQLRSLVFKYIEPWYNTQRRHSSLVCLSPKQHKQKH